MNLCWILYFNLNSIMLSACTLLITLGLDTNETVYDTLVLLSRIAKKKKQISVPLAPSAGNKN